MKTGLKLFIFVMLGGVIAVVAAAQQQTGETWRMKMSMEMSDFSMPEQTSEVCVTAGQNPDDAMMRQQNNSGNCQTTNQKKSGNKTSADLKCTGKDAMEAHYEFETLGDTVRGTMTMKTSDGPMTAKYEMTKIGKPCVDKAAVMAKQAEQQRKQADDAMSELMSCSSRLKNAGDNMEERYRIFFGSSPGKEANSGNIADVMKAMGVEVEEDCRKKDATSFQKFCSDLQPTSMDGFWSDGDSRGRDRFSFEKFYGQHPDALKACGVSEVAVKTKLLPQAEKEGRWDYLLRYGGDEYYSRLTELAKKECAGRDFTNNTNPQYRRLCMDYGMALISGDRHGALDAAGCSEEIPERGICVGYGSSGSNRRATSRAAEQESAGSNEGSGAAPKPKNPIESGRQKIRGLLGR